MGKLHDREIPDVIRAFVSISDASAIGSVLEADPRLRLPEFHAILRQKYLQLLHEDGTSSEFGAFEGRYLDFFAYLLREWYEQTASELDAQVADGARDRAIDEPRDRSRPLLESTRSRMDLGLAAIVALDKLGALDVALPGVGARSGPFLVEAERPLAVLEYLKANADEATLERCRPLLEQVEEVAGTLPPTRRTVSSVLRCRHPGSRDLVTILHRCYVDASDDAELRASLGTINPHWSASSEVGLIPVEFLAADAPIDADPLFASCSVLVPVPGLRVCLPPPLLGRDEERDRILEVQISRLELLCARAIGGPEQAGATAFHLCYDRDELQEHVRAGIEAAGRSGAVDALIGEGLFEEIQRKVRRGEMPLDMAVAQIREMARRAPDMPLPPFAHPSQVGGDPWPQLIAATLFEAIVESRPGLWPLKIGSAMSASAAYRLFGDVGQAAAAQQRAARHLEEAERVGEAGPEARAAVWNGAGDVHFDRGESEAAIEMWGKAVEVYGQSTLPAEGRLNSLVIRQKLGHALREAASLTAAKQAFEQVAADARELRASLLGPAVAELPEEQREFYAHNATYAQSGAVSNVGSLYSAALVMLRPLVLDGTGPTVAGLPDTASDPKEAFVRAAVARFLEADGVAPETAIDDDVLRRIGGAALDRFEEALELAESVDGSDYAATQAVAIARTLLDLGGDPTDALRYARRAGNHAARGIRRETRADVERTLADAFVAVGQPDDAIEALKRAIDAQIRMRVASGTEQIRRHADVQLRDRFTRLARLLIEAGRSQQAIETAETIKSNLLAVELSRTAPRIAELGDDPAVEELQARMARRQVLLQTLSSQPAADVQTITLLHELEGEIDTLRETLMLRHPRFAEWCRWSTLESFDLSRLQGVAGDAAVFGLVLGSEGAGWRYSVRGGDVAFEPCSDSPEQLERLVGAVSRIHRALAADSYSLDEARAAFRPLARAFSPMVERLVGDGNSSVLIICPDGPFHALPWALLPVGGGILVEHTVLHNVYGLGVAAALFDRGEPTGGEGLLMVIDPLAGTEHELPGAHEEADSIRAALGDDAWWTLEGSHATIEALSGACVGRQVMHLACHGKFGGLADAAGELYLAPGGERTTASGILTPRLISERLDLRAASLVNLAACEVGLVRPELETEIDGIGRACLAAGAGGVLASLWPLRDRAAAVFSGRYYEHLRRMDHPARALQATQLDCLRGDLGQHMTRPANWASYVYVGVPRSRRAGRQMKRPTHE